MTLPSKKISFYINSGAITSAKRFAFSAQRTELEKARYKSLLGTDVYDTIWFQGGNYQDLNGNLITYGGGEGSFIRMDSVLLNVSQTKRIITTALQGRDGTVKEYISNGDYIISMRGKIVNTTSDYPLNFSSESDHCDVTKLVEILKVPNEIDVISDFLNLFFDQIVITDFYLPQNEGIQNEQAFEINALSYTNIELNVEA